MKDNKINFFKDEIVSIEEYDEIDTIDIMVEDTHMFFANDIYTHNSSFNAELVDHTQMGGNIKRAQKSHFLMSIAKNSEQKLAGLANMQILKARFAQDGHVFKDSIFNNDTMEIRITGDLPRSKKIVEKTDTPESLDDKLNKYSGDNGEVFNKDELKNLLGE
jgi:hypothetical protein